MPIVTSESYRRAFNRASKTLVQVSSNFFSQAGIRANLPQPPFPHLLRSNTPPTESEISLIQDAITIAEDEESRLKEMGSSHTGSDRLTSKTVMKLAGRTHQFIIEHNAILSSIRCIPPEILRNIFIYTLPSPTAATPGSRVPCISQLPWALSQVCQLWRTIMLSFSVMWSDLPIVDLHKAHTREKPFLGLLTELLKRSHNMPIRLTILGGSIAPHPAINMLVLHSDRWREIMMRGSFGVLGAFKKIKGHLIKGHLSSLQSLQLHIFYACEPPMAAAINDSVRNLFQIAPQLRHVDFCGPSCKLLFPTHQLVHYFQEGAYLEQVIQNMASSPSLTKLGFDARYMTREIAFGPSPVTAAVPAGPSSPMVALRLPDLIFLEANFQLMSTIYEPFFNNITTPALEELLVGSSTEDTLRPIYSMILRSGCLLKVLDFNIVFAPGELQSIFELTPLVTKITIAFPRTQDVSALIFDGNTPPLLPLLTECDLFRGEHPSGNKKPSMETIQALKLLASSRCELPGNTTSAEMLLSNGFHLLQILRISLDIKSIPHRQYFEGWVDSDMTNELHKLHVRLLGVLPELFQCKIPSSRRMFDLEWKSKVTGLLTHLETLKIEKASDICISGLQYLLYAISIGFSKGDARFSFSPIAKRILEKWEPILRDDMPNIRWYTTSFYLRYLPTTQNHALCLSPDATKTFFYELDTNDISNDHYVQLYDKLAYSMVCGTHISRMGF